MSRLLRNAHPMCWRAIMNWSPKQTHRIYVKGLIFKEKPVDCVRQCQCGPTLFLDFDSRERATNRNAYANQLAVSVTVHMIERVNCIFSYKIRRSRIQLCYDSVYCIASATKKRKQSRRAREKKAANFFRM